MNVKICALGERIHNALVDYTKETGIFQPNLGGLCAVASCLLVTEARRKYGLEMEFTAVNGHAWTEYKGEIYDVTATQFGHMGKVFSAPRTKLLSVENKSLTYYYDLLHEEGRRKDLLYINKEWPATQQPKNYIIKWLNHSKARVTFVQTK